MMELDPEPLTYCARCGWPAVAVNGRGLCLRCDLADPADGDADPDDGDAERERRWLEGC